MQLARYLSTVPCLRRPLGCWIPTITNSISRSINRASITHHPQQLRPRHISTFSSQIDHYLASLNGEQQQAVYSTSSVIRVKAGPGSGKTRVVTARVANLLKRGEPASRILVITFTNKAASELKERLQSILGYARGTTGVLAGTFHTISARIIRNFIEHLPSSSPAAAGFRSTAGTGLRKLDTWNITNSFTILDADDSKRAMRKVVDSYPLIQGAKLSAKIADSLTGIYSNIRSQFATVHNGFSWTEAMDQIDRMDRTGLLAGIHPLGKDDLPYCFDLYDSVCRVNNSVDFDDLLSLTVALLQQLPGVRQHLHGLWKHVLVDEFQDTNAAQYEIVRLLRGPDASTFVVGDSDQAIYSWRGANPDNMDIKFKQHFPACETLFLSRNYRSGSNIVDEAEVVLSHEGLPDLHQTPIVMKETLGHVEHVVVDSERQEASWVTSTIRELTKSGSATRFKDIAVIYRKNIQSRLFQESLAGAGIPFTVLGDKSFWSRSEVKVMTCYLRLTANPGTDSLALDEVINMPPRKIGDKSIEKMLEVAKGKSVSLASLLLGDLMTIAPLTDEELQPLLFAVECSGELPPEAIGLIPDVGSQLVQQHNLKLNKNVLAGLRQLRAIIFLARSTALCRPVSAVVNLLQLTSGFLDYIEEEGKENQMDNLRMLHSISKDPDAWISREEDLKGHKAGADSGSPLEQLQLLLQHVALMRDADELEGEDEEGQRVSLMTIHASKGLEFKHVFFVGLVDGLVPLIRLQFSSIPHKDLMEEKRLAYVGCTRAMDSLYLVRARVRQFYGSNGSFEQESKPSRFFPRL